MAETKIKVNELPSATPTLNDTLVGSNATKEYACKIEDLLALGGGGVGAPFIIHTTLDGDNVVLDKTWQEIWDAVSSGMFAYVTSVVDEASQHSYTLGLVGQVSDDHNDYSVLLVTNLNAPFLAESADDYPVYEFVG